MKKFLLGVIFIIPIVVMVAISAATSIIAIATSPLPEILNIYDDNGIELQDREAIELEITDTQRYITIEVLPVLVQDDSIDYTLEEDSGEGRLDLKRDGQTDRYLIIPKQSGAVSVTIRANSNINLVRTLTFVINTREITGISICDGDGKEGDSLKILTQTQLYVAIAPVVAIDGYNLSWKTSNESIVKVSPNGIIYPVSRGEAYISVSAKDKIGKIHSDSILIDTSQALTKSPTVYTSSEITISWIYGNVVLSPTVSVVKVDYTNYIVTENNNSINLKIVFCDPNEWGFNDGRDVLYTRSAPYFADIGYLDISKDGELEDVAFVSDNPQVLAVDGNVLLPLKGGEATVTAFYGGKTKTKTYVVKENPAVLNLSLSAADAKLGIKLTRTWGLYWYDANYNLISSYQLSVDSHIDVVWTVDDETKAEVSQDGLVTFKQACRGRKVTVTASTLVDNRLTGVSRSFTFNMQNNDAINVYDFDQLSRANSTKKYNMVLQNNMDSPYEIILYNSVYGNGFTISAEIRNCTNPRNWGKIFLLYNPHDPAYYTNLPVLAIEDVILIGRTNFENASHVGVEVYEINTKVVLRYIVARNFNIGIAISSSSDTLIEGCILGDNGTHAVTIAFSATDCLGEERVTLRNNIIKMSKGPAITMTPRRFEPEEFGKNILPELHIEGFLDIYNWKTEAEIGPAFNVFNVEDMDFLASFIDPKYLADVINDALADLMSSKAMSHLFYKDKDGNRFVSLGVFALGAIFKLDKAKFNIKDKNLTLMNMPLANVDGSAGVLIDIINAFTTANGMPINNGCYFIGYDFANREPVIKPGDAVPQNYDLYKRLQSGVPDISDPGSGGDYDVC